MVSCYVYVTKVFIAHRLEFGYYEDEFVVAGEVFVWKGGLCAFSLALKASRPRLELRCGATFAIFCPFQVCSVLLRYLNKI